MTGLNQHCKEKLDRRLYVDHQIPDGLGCPDCFDEILEEENLDYYDAECDLDVAG